MAVYMLQHVFKSQRATSGNQFFPSTMDSRFFSSSRHACVASAYPVSYVNGPLPYLVETGSLSLNLGLIDSVRLVGLSASERDLCLLGGVVTDVRTTRVFVVVLLCLFLQV